MNGRYLLIIIVIIFTVQMIFSKGNDDRGKDNKGNNDAKGLENQKDNQDKGYKLREERKSDSEQDESKDIKKEEIQFRKKLSERTKICIKLTEDSQKLSKEMTKNITKDDMENLSGNYKSVKNNINKLNEEKNNLFNILNGKQKEEVKDQLSIIEESQKNMNFKIEQFDIELNKEKINKNKILNMNNELEQEINKVERQFRAIEWLLTEE